MEAELVWQEGTGGAGRSVRQPLDLIQKGLTPLLLESRTMETSVGREPVLQLPGVTEMVLGIDSCVLQ